MNGDCYLVLNKRVPLNECGIRNDTSLYPAVVIVKISFDSDLKIKMWRLKTTLSEPF